MRRKLRFKIASQRAAMVLREHGLSEPPIDPIALAERLDIQVEAKPSAEEGVSGMLLRHGDAFLIVYATHIPVPGYQRFSIAHELGHYLLDGHIDHVLPQDGVHASRAGFVSGDLYEREADHFAASLLMPTDAFGRDCRRRVAGLQTVIELAETGETSLTATAIRYAELTDDAVAVILSTDTKIDYCFLSERMLTLPELQIPKKGSAVPESSVAFEIGSYIQKVHSAEQASEEIDVIDWLGGTRSINVAEQTVGLGRYGKVLTILSSEEIGHEDQNDVLDDELTDGWTPRFHK